MGVLQAFNIALNDQLLHILSAYVLMQNSTVLACYESIMKFIRLVLLLEVNS